MVIRTLLKALAITVLLLILIILIGGGLLYLNQDLRVNVLKTIFNESGFKFKFVRQQPHTENKIKFDKTQNRRWILTKRPPAEVTLDCFEFEVIPKPTITKGKILLQNTHFSFDPTQKVWMIRDTYKKVIPLGSPMEAITISVVVESQHPNYQVGDTILNLGSWQDFFVYDPELGDQFISAMVIPKGVSPYVALTAITDLTAIGGILRVGKVKPGDKVLVSGAAGATGSIAGQAAKLLGASVVVGIAGGQQKKNLLTSQFGFDIGIDYKAEDVKLQVNQIFGKTGGIDVYFDNVGGEILNIALGNVSHGGRIVLCGAISHYNDLLTLKTDLSNYVKLVLREAKMEGFLVIQYIHDPVVLFRWLYWLSTGQLVHHVQIHNNFNNLPDTLIGLFQGSNVGKLILENDIK